MEDTVNLAIIYGAIKEKIPTGSTHFMVTLRSRNGAGLYRACDGMFIAEAGDKTCILGENPNKRESRLFVNHEFARQHLQKVADDDLGAAALVFDFDYEQYLADETSLYLPGGSESLIVNGSLKLDGKMPSVRKLN